MIDSIKLFRELEEFERRSERFDIHMAAVEQQREASGQNAMLEKARAYKETQGQQDAPDRYAVFDTMSADWGGEEDGFVYHAIPQECERTGGYFPEKMQCYTYILCNNIYKRSCYIRNINMPVKIATPVIYPENFLIISFSSFKTLYKISTIEI